MKRVEMINSLTGSKMLVAENRVTEYEKLGHKRVSKKNDKKPKTKNA